MPLLLRDPAQRPDHVVVGERRASSIVLPSASAVSMLLVAMAPGQPKERKAILALLPPRTAIQSLIWSPQEGSPTIPYPSVSPSDSSPTFRGFTKWSITTSL
jgi:hypothetical protein